MLLFFVEDRVKCEPGWIADQTTGYTYVVTLKFYNKYLLFFIFSKQI